MSERPVESGRDLELAIGRLLRIGVAAAALLVLLGAAVYLWHHGSEMADYRRFRGEPSDLRHLGAIFADAAVPHGRGLIQLGLLLLIATPVMRVAYAAWAFARQRDGLYVLVTLLVLAVLLFSLLFMR